jgi:hypothetical protein
MSASLLILRHCAVRKLAELVTFNVLAADWGKLSKQMTDPISKKSGE